MFWKTSSFLLDSWWSSLCFGGKSMNCVLNFDWYCHFELFLLYLYIHHLRLFYLDNSVMIKILSREFHVFHND
jgi:hypothetical protein